MKKPQPSKSSQSRKPTPSSQSNKASKPGKANEPNKANESNKVRSQKAPRVQVATVAPVEAKEPTLPEFYLIVTPGLEEVAKAELLGWEPGLADVRVERGGLTVFAPLSVGLGLNRKMKTVTRILLRLSAFGCRDFPKLFKKVSGFAWADWVGDDIKLVFHASAHRSRLFVKKRIEKTCVEAREAYLKKNAAKNAAKEAAEIDVFVRVADDVCTLSLDTSGEMLHKRGHRTLSSEAPLRETMAAALLLMLESKSESVQAPQIELVDPMTGGGTFLLEAAALRQTIESRTFAYELCQPLLERTRTESQAESSRKQSRSGDPYASFVGFDLDPKALSSARQNLASLGDTRPLHLENADFLHASPLPEGPRRWLIANPPYGERIKVQGRLKDYYQSLFQACEAVARPERACFILPEKVNPKQLRWPAQWRLLHEQKFLNGGLAVAALVFARNV